MKNFFLILFLTLLIFLGLTYWSVSIGPEVVSISKVTEEVKDNSGRTTSVRVITSNLYESNAVKRFIQGQNYRQAWATEIDAPSLYLDSLEILEEGGGSQTHSLEIRSPAGHTYSLRSVNKDPEPLIPEIAYRLGLENIVVDGISAQHPYGALPAAALAESSGILHTRPRIFFLPKQQKLSKYSYPYGDKVYLLEYETKGKVNWTHYPDVLEIVDTDKLQQMKLIYGKKLRVDTDAFVRARMFDLLIGDWDRHAKQWGWVIQQKDGYLIAIPLPGDRDNAFFRIDGVLPTLLTNALVQPLVRPFEEDIDYIQGYVYPIDVYFLRSVPEEVFVREARFLQSKLTDQQIRNALEVWPASFSQQNGDEIFRILKNRREKLADYALAFKKEITRRPLLQKPLKGSEDLDLPAGLLNCFECMP